MINYIHVGLSLACHPLFRFVSVDLRVLCSPNHNRATDRRAVYKQNLGSAFSTAAMLNILSSKHPLRTKQKQKTWVHIGKARANLTTIAHTLNTLIVTLNKLNATRTQRESEGKSANTDENELVHVDTLLKSLPSVSARGRINESPNPYSFDLPIDALGISSLAIQPATVKDYFYYINANHDIQAFAFDVINSIDIYTKHVSHLDTLLSKYSSLCVKMLIQEEKKRYELKLKRMSEIHRYACLARGKSHSQTLFRHRIPRDASRIE